MGNLIKDFWTYQDYYGITEVVGGSLEYRKVEGKYETRIEKALAYMLEPGRRMLSHMSVQTYNEYLNKTGRVLRSENEKAYYPMLFELETKIKPEPLADFVGLREKSFQVQYKEMLIEAYLLVTYLIFEIGMEEKDILIMLNNSRSIYIMINPVSYGLVPSKDISKIYKEMYSLISENVSLEYADKQMYKHNGLMKTPNTWYNGGYFVPISYAELQELRENPSLKSKFTKNKRTLDYEVPGGVCPSMVELYEKAKENISESNLNTERFQMCSGTRQNSKYENNNIVYMPKAGQRNCINYIHENEIEDGKKNFALVSIVYHYKGLGYSQEQTYEILQKTADEWNYENANRINAKVKSIYRSEKKFSCDKAKDCLGLEDMCNSCPCRNKKQENNNTRFKVQKIVIERLWENKASLRHYKAYLQLSRKNLFNRWFSLEVEGIPERTLKDLCKLSGSFIFSQNGDYVIVYNKNQDLKGQYCLIPNEFWDSQVYNLLEEQLKHYLKLLFMGYKTSKNGKYIHMQVSKERIKALLGYETIGGVYKLLQKLSKLGFAVFKCKLFALYFNSYKVIDIEEKMTKHGDMDLLQNIENVIGGEPFFINKKTDGRGSLNTC